MAPPCCFLISTFMAKSASVQDRLKTIIYEIPGQVQGETERRISEMPSYTKQRLSSGSVDPNAGPSPVRLRYRTAYPEKRAYVNILVEGKSNEDLSAPLCDGVNYGFESTPKTRGSAMCNLPGTTITGGYDTFGRSIKARKWQTDPVCPWDLLSDLNKGEAYLNGLLRDLPIRATNEFGEALEDEVLAASKFNFSMVGGWVYAAGAFPAVPTGTLDIGYIKRIKAFFQAQPDWGNAPFEIEVGADALWAAVHAWNTARGYTIQINNITGQANTIIGKQTVEFEGIRFVLNDFPTRGWLRTTAAGSEFVRVPMEINRSGTGDGVVADLNVDYLNCTTVCDGQRHDVYEVARVIHPMFAQRQAMSPVILKNLKLQYANMEMKLIGGAHIDCNEFDEKFYYAMRHVYGFEVMNPELAGCILYRAAPAPIAVVDTTCPADCVEDFGDPVTMSELPPPDSDDCSDSQWDETTEVAHYVDVGSVTDPGPDESAVGVIRFVGIEATAAADSTVYLIVERSGGYNGASTVHIGTASGTATSGTDFTAVSSTLSWADGEDGRKRVAIVLLPAATPGQNFTATLSSVTNSTLDGDNDVATITVASACA